MRLCSNRAASVGQHLALAATVLAVLAAPPRPAQSQLAVTCVNCWTIWNQLLEYGKQVQQLATQLQSYQTQLQQYANMVTNTLALPQQLWARSRATSCRSETCRTPPRCSRVMRVP
jgi:P-type conjugative transfer protein TrbJ